MIAGNISRQQGRLLPTMHESGKKLIIAHRGASRHAAENTLAAFQKAVDIGADMIEFDIRKTKDNIPIAYHNKTAFGRPVNSFTFKEIREQFREKNIEIPAFEEILELGRGRIKLDVEFKETGYENQILEKLQRHFGKNEFIVSSTNPRQLKDIKNTCPDVRTGLIIGLALNREKINLIKSKDILSELNPDLLVLQWRLLKSGLIEGAGSRRVFVWTVNSKSLINEFINDKRVEGIITDVPDLALSLRDRNNQEGRHLRLY